MKNESMLTGEGYYDGKGIWFTSISMNGLFYYDIENDFTACIERFADEKIWKENMFFVQIKMGDFIYFIPYDYKYLPVYNIKKSEMKYYSLFKHDFNNLHYFSWFIKDNYIYIFPINLADPLIRINVYDNNEIKIIDFWSKNVKTNEENDYFISGLRKWNNYIWISFYGLKEIQRIEINSLKTDKIVFDEISKPIILNVNEQGLWIGGDNGNVIYKVDSDLGLTKKYELDEKMIVSRLIFLKSGEAVILPHNFEIIYIYDNDALIRKIELNKISEFKMTGKKNISCMFHYLEINNELWIMPQVGNSIVIINLYDYSVRTKKIPFPANISESELKFIDRIQKSVADNYDGKLIINTLDEVVLNSLVKLSGFCNKENNNKNAVGRAIHQEIFKNIVF